MRIVVDMQGAQAQDWGSDITKEIITFTQALVRNHNEHEFFLVLSDLLPESIEAICIAFKVLLPRKNIRVWSVPTKDKFDEVTHLKISQSIREAFLASLQPDIIHYTGDIMQKKSSNCIFSIGHSNINIPITVSIYKHNKIEYIQALALPKLVNNVIDDFFTDFIIPLDLDCEKNQNIILPLSVKNSNSIKTDNVYALNFLHDVIQTESNTSSVDFEKCAKLVVNGWEEIVQEVNVRLPEKKKEGLKKPKLAHISPLPPQRSGIADYSAELISYLLPFYDIDVVVDQDVDISCTWNAQNYQILTMEEFAKNYENYDRVLYHFGNNPMHAKMFELLEQCPGVVVLHDFFLGDLQSHRETSGSVKNAYRRELYLSHGYNAINKSFIEDDHSTISHYPCNFSIFQKALGVIVHSEYSRKLAAQWYDIYDNLAVIPLLREKAEVIDRKEARKQLGISEDEFVVCSFGFLGITKQNHRLLDAWEASQILGNSKKCKLIYVGDEDQSLYSLELSKRIRKYSKTKEVQITGWTDTTVYKLYLAAADVAVQLRTSSRGETSAAVLDTMNYAVATIVNANGSMDDIPNQMVRKIPDDFTDNELKFELEYLFQNSKEKESLACRAQEFIHTQHAPENCANEYVLNIEKFYDKSSYGLKSIIDLLAKNLPFNIDDENLYEHSRLLALNFPNRASSRTLFVDMSVVVRDDLKTGVQRVVRALTLALIKEPPKGFRVEPVYLTDKYGVWNYCYARNYTLDLLNVDPSLLADEVIDTQAGDIFVGLDFAAGYVIEANRCKMYRNFQKNGVHVSFIVYDLLPILFENFFPRESKGGHTEWLKAITDADSAICISEAVADDLRNWVKKSCPERLPRLDIKSFHLGADLGTSAPSRGLPDNAEKLLRKLKSNLSFLMVGTIEPRKGHEQVLDAFDQLWLKGIALNLVVVGKKGWMVDSLAKRLHNHPELGKRLFWLEGVSDEYLEKIYASTKCLIAASYGEGFGLPLIEAAQHQIPIIARDIPVFREVASEHAFYFKADEPSDLATAIQNWLVQYQENQHPTSVNMPWLTWEQSAQQLLNIVLD